MAAVPPQTFAFAPAVVEVSDSAVADTSGYASPAWAEPSLLEPYEAFEGSAPRAAEPAPLGMREALLAIVACEGPMLGERLQTAYVRAAGGQRVGRAAASAVNKVISSAVRRGLLVEASPLRKAGVQPRTYRLPHQPMALPRVLGPRALDEVPPAELAVVMAVHAEDLGWSNP